MPRQKYHFSVHYYDLIDDDAEGPMLIGADAWGDTLDELLRSVQPYVLGDKRARKWTLADLPDAMIEMIEQDIREYIEDAEMAGGAVL